VTSNDVDLEEMLRSLHIYGFVRSEYATPEHDLRLQEIVRLGYAKTYYPFLYDITEAGFNFLESRPPTPPHCGQIRISICHGQRYCTCMCQGCSKAQCQEKAAAKLKKKKRNGTGS
jgi:hypothetical protein